MNRQRLEKIGQENQFVLPFSEVEKGPHFRHSNFILGQNGWSPLGEIPLESLGIAQALISFWDKKDEGRPFSTGIREVENYLRDQNDREVFSVDDQRYLGFYKNFLAALFWRDLYKGMNFLVKEDYPNEYREQILYWQKLSTSDLEPFIKKYCYVSLSFFHLEGGKVFFERLLSIGEIAPSQEVSDALAMSLQEVFNQISFIKSISIVAQA
jgi:hypothetical protein